MSITTRSNRPNTNSGSLGQFMRSREVIFHEAAPIAYRPNPQFNPSVPAGPLNPAEIPFVMKLGKAGTYDIGRNAAKREKRKAA